MRDARWTKLWRDLGAERGRALILIIGIAAGVFGVGTVLGARAILLREMHRNYLGTHPPGAVVELAAAPPALVDAVRARPGIAAVTARATIHARVESAPVGAPGPRAWRPIVLFVAPADRMPEVGSVTPLDGPWPPAPDTTKSPAQVPDEMGPVALDGADRSKREPGGERLTGSQGTVWLERTAAALLGARPGDTLRIRLPGGAPRELAVSGLVHDPALAPAAMERTAWAYATPATIAALGGSGALDELWVTFAPAVTDLADADARARELGAWLGANGATVHALRVTPPGRHPHESQMRAILLMMLVFSALALGLGGVLAATLIAGLLARQVREIGVMKAIGARTRQLAAMYLVLLVALGAAAVALAVPPSVLAARGFADAIAALLNLELASRAVPMSITAIQVAAGLVVPIAIAAIPVGRATRTTVRAALDRHGAAPTTGALARLTIGGTITRMAVRNSLRRPARLGLTLGMLAVGGALFLSALDLASAWARETDEVTTTRHYAVELRVDRAAPTALTAALERVPGVRAAEAWGTSPAALVTAGQLDIVRTYPDGGHGSLRILGVPAGTAMVSFPQLAGRWLAPDDTDGVVINHMMAAQAPELGVGGTLTLALEGTPTTWRVIGVVRDVGSAATVYAPDTALARALGAPATARLFRVATTTDDPEAQRATVAALERALEDAGYAVDVAIPLAELRTAIGDHMQVLIATLLAMAALMGLVGVLGLASAMSTSVLERTRELGVMRALGATPGALARLIGIEAIVIALFSWLTAIALSIPLAMIVGRVVGALAFRTPLPLVVRADAIVAWLAIMLGVGLIAAIAPARRAIRCAIREALATV